MGEPANHSEWSHKELIERVTYLEQQLRSRRQNRYRAATTWPRPSSPPRKPKNARVNREFNPSKYSTRLVALKFAYLGQRYNGLEYHPNNKTPLPTVEEELWKALNKARLIFPTPNPSIEEGELNWEGCDYSKCGRTDKGVSAFGQVVGVRIRSNRPLSRPQSPTHLEEDGSEKESMRSTELELASLPLASDQTQEVHESTSPSDHWDPETLSFHPIRDEILYSQVLNRLLPPDIRILAWCPSPPLDFSARFSCKERRYRYFFTQPAFSPTVGSAGLVESINSQGRKRREGYLDIEAMRKAAHKFIGLHDFRNFCKVDASKQIENFERRIFHADIEELDHNQTPTGYVGKPGFQQYESSDRHPDQGLPPSISPPTLYTFTFHGSAFLWHQVRHMVAILFLVGQGLEPPSLVSDLLNIQKTPRKPMYEIAEDAPLVLWDCIFPRQDSGRREDSLEWVHVGDRTEGEDEGDSVLEGKMKVPLDGKFGYGGVVTDLWKMWRKRKIDEVLAGTLLDLVVAHGTRNGAGEGVREAREAREGARGGSQKVFQGGDGHRLLGRYIPVLEKPRMESVEAINEKYAKRKGFEQGTETRERGFRRVEVQTGDVV